MDEITKLKIDFTLSLMSLQYKVNAIESVLTPEQKQKYSSYLESQKSVYREELEQLLPPERVDEYIEALNPRF